jgi:hypothetical protein
MSTITVELQLNPSRQQALNDLMRRESIRKYEDAIYFLIDALHSKKNAFDSKPIPHSIEIER